MEIEAGSLSYQLVDRRLTQQTAPPRLVRTPDDDMAHAMGATKIQKCFNSVFRPQAHDLRAEIPRPLFVFQEMTLQCSVDAVIRFALGFHMHDKPVGIQPAGQTRALSEQHSAM